MSEQDLKDAQRKGDMPAPHPLQLTDWEVAEHCQRAEEAKKLGMWTPTWDVRALASLASLASLAVLAVLAVFALLASLALLALLALLAGRWEGAVGCSHKEVVQCEIAYHASADYTRHANPLHPSQEVQAFVHGGSSRRREAYMTCRIA